MTHPEFFARTLSDVRRLADFSGLSHDIGKLTQQFLGKLQLGQPQRDAISHEWVSAWVLAHMLECGAVNWESWCAAWNAWETDGARHVLRHGGTSAQAWRPFTAVDDFRSAALMVVATHHRLLSLDAAREHGRHARRTRPDDAQLGAPQQNHVSGVTPTTDETLWRRPASWDAHASERKHWQQVLAQGQQHWAQASDQAAPAEDARRYWHKVALIARAAVVWADQHVSRINFADHSDKATYGKVAAYANSWRGRPGRSTQLNQPLTWHLMQVGARAKDHAGFFGPQNLPAVPAGVRHAARPQPEQAGSARFAWQAHAYEFIRRTRAECQGAQAFLIFNVASTGSGKTRANFQVLDACRRPDEPLRVTAGFNLKTLTLQTGRAYRKELGLSADDCACIIGDPLARSLHLHEELDDEQAAAPESVHSSGCDSKEFLESLPDWVLGLDEPDKGHHHATLVAAPVVVATMDYLVAAGDPTQQAGHVHALLRLAHSDLIVDEADSYDPEGLVAVLRVVHMAGMFGRNVVIASATLSPVLAERIEQAWQSGLALCRAGESAPLHAQTLLLSNLGGPAGTHSRHGLHTETFGDWYRAQLAGLYAATADTPVHRLACIVPIQPCSSDARSALYGTVAQTCLKGHVRHGWPAAWGERKLRVSVGVVRLANVTPVQELADFLVEQTWPCGVAVKVCAYHARELAMRRYLKEQALDRLLKRAGDPDLAQHPLIKAALAEQPEHIRELILIVVASPVEEVGRDHDFDWAVIEPSSLHAIIQLTGRVNRHRLRVVTRPNIFILARNLKSLEGEQLSFSRPGLQQGDKRSPKTHLQADMAHLLQPVSSKARLGKPFALDAGLIFDPTRRCAFAEEDDKAITHLLANTRVFFEPDCPHWACDWLYATYPLREHTPRTTWRVEPRKTGGLKFEKYDPKNWRGETWIETDDVHDPREARPTEEKHVWLSPTVHQAEKQLREQLADLHGADEAQLAELVQQARQFSVESSADDDDAPLVRWTGVRPRKAKRWTA